MTNTHTHTPLTSSLSFPKEEMKGAKKKGQEQERENPPGGEKEKARWAENMCVGVFLRGSGWRLVGGGSGAAQSAHE